MNKGFTTPEHSAAMQAAYRQKCQYIRRGKTITEVATGETVATFSSINKAKRDKDYRPRFVF